MPNKLFFISSREIVSNITSVFDFVWPTAAAMWNLRWQVDGFLRADPAASEEMLVSRFIGGSQIRGANLRLACIETSWEQQQEQFAKFLLIEICALYEAWLEAIKAELNLASFNVKGFQFPSNGNGGVRAALGSAQANVSVEMSSCIHPSLARNAKYSFSRIDELTKCYRFFKECRNALIHRGSLADQRVLDAYADYDPLTKNDLGLREKPVYAPLQNIGDKVSIQLRGAVGLADVVIRMISSLDAELCKCQEAEYVLTSMSNCTHGGTVTFPFDPEKKRRKVLRMITKLNLPSPASPDILLDLLKRHRLAN